MLHDLPAYQASLDTDYTIDDVTMILGVRLHEGNPWVLERLAWHATWYSPRPRIIVVDFGSKEPFRSAIADTCRQHEMQLYYEDDPGIYSAARARNVGFTQVTTPLVYFNDVDCFGPTDHFDLLLRAANALGLASHADQMLNLPVVHLSEEATSSLRSAQAHERGRRLHRLSIDALRTSFGNTADFVAPYSNVFLCRREMFDLVGGYDESFRGHGSEDFEFLLRFVFYIGGLPIPDNVEKDCFGPLRPEFFQAKPYQGFRRLFEALALPAELEGLRTVHLHHDKPPQGTGGWYERNDWRRGRFNEALAAYLDKPIELLRRDWLPRTKRCLVLVKHEEHAAFFAPLRWAGFALEVLPLNEAGSLPAFVDRIQAKEFDAVAIFNPYMKSHASLRPYFELAKERGAEPIVVERGALPESWYYAAEVSYADPDFTNLDVDSVAVTERELDVARTYRKRLASGRFALEQQQDPETTRGRLHVYSKWAPRRVLIPLQLDEDMAVTRFTDGHILYSDFKKSLSQLGDHPDTLFLIKPHPLDKHPFKDTAPNVIVCNDHENIHALIDAVDAVICFNSGVGLLAILQNKKVVTLGNAYYNRSGVGRRAGSLESAITLALDEWDPASDETLDRLTAWLLFRKYSFFKAKDVLREFENRLSHGYKDQRFYRVFVPSKLDVRWARAAFSRPLQEGGYSAARLGLSVERPSETPRRQPPSPNGAGVTRKIRKLIRDPGRFFADAHNPLIRSVGSRVFSHG